MTLSEEHVVALESRIRSLQRELARLPERSARRRQIEAQLDELQLDLDLARRQQPLFPGPEAA